MTEQHETSNKAISMIEAAISNMAASKTALGYCEMDMKSLARIVFSNWKHVSAELERLSAALQDIASQKKTDEMCEAEVDGADFENAYDVIIGRARTALHPVEPASTSGSAFSGDGE